MPTLDEELADLEKRIRQLKIEFDIFLVGGKKTPPRMLQGSVESLIQKLLEEKRWNFSQKFKFQTLVARYSSYRELWRKRMQEREEKGRLRDEEELQQLIEHNLTTIPEERAPDSFTLVTEDPSRELDKVAAMYQFLQDAHHQVGSSSFNMDIAKFHIFLQSKTNEIRAKTNCKAVEFQVQIDLGEGRVKFSAKTKK
jgi:hypothetical protein